MQLKKTEFLRNPSIYLPAHCFHYNVSTSPVERSSDVIPNSEVISLRGKLALKAKYIRGNQTSMCSKLACQFQSISGRAYSMLQHQLRTKEYQ